MSAKAGETVTITTNPDLGYKVDSVSVKRNNTSVAVTDNGNSTYSFKQPASSVSVSVSFTLATESTTPDSSTQDETNIAFADVSTSDWFYQAITFVAEKGIMAGTGSNTFEPYSKTTRGMIATVLYSLAGKPEVQGLNHFSDVSDSAWYVNAVIWANELGVAHGTGNNTFTPEGYMTREELVVMLYGYANMENLVNHQADYPLSYPDTQDISDWATVAVAWATEQNLILGRDTGNFAPQDTATRAEVAVILQNFVNFCTQS